MKKLLSLAVLLLFSCASCTWFSAERKPEASATPADKPAKAEPAKPQPAEKAAVQPKDAKPADKAASPADPLAFLPDVVAKIGDEKITRDNIKDEFKPIFAMMKESGQLEGITQEVWKAEVKERLDDIIASKLLLKLAMDDGYKPDPAKAEEEFKNVTSQIPPDQLDATLKKQGMSPEMIKEKIGIGLAIQKWIDEKISANVKVSEADAEKYYRENQERFKKPESVRASHILIKIDEPEDEAASKMSDDEKAKFTAQAKEKAKKKAEDILAQLKQGGDFEKLAKENSACPSKEKGGDLGVFEKGRMTEDFEKAAFALNPGEISGVVETDFGFHIIKTTEKIKPEYMPFNDVKGFLMEGMKNQKISETVQSKIEEEKKNRKVEILIN